MREDEGHYLVQCMSGHVMEVIPESDLEAKCKKRAEDGKLDALCFGGNECPICVANELQSRKEYFGLFGCPMADIDSKCEDNCLCKQDVGESPYTDQVRSCSAAVNW